MGPVDKKIKMETSAGKRKKQSCEATKAAAIMKTANRAAPGKTKEGEPEQNELQLKPHLYL